jgi:hypothetical protein
MLSPTWAARESQEHEEILKRHPFDDYASVRARFCKSLRDQGYSVEQADKMADDKYPLPKKSNG